MVSISAPNSVTSEQLVEGLSAPDSARVLDALAYATEAYGDKQTFAGRSALEFAIGVATTLAFLRSDAETRIAGLMFELTLLEPDTAADIEPRFGKQVCDLATGVRQLIRLRALTQAQHGSAAGRGKNAAQQAVAQVETLRKMLLAMASDMRVVLVRLAACVTTLRYFAELKLFNEMTREYGKETLDLYAPLANRLGIWQLKWELEDLSFRFIEPEAYKRIAKMLEEKRMMREGFVSSAILRLQTELAAAGIQAEVFGRPKHIYSIWNKMRGKELDFTALYDVRAFRVIVSDVKTCYTVLGVVHNIWTPIPKEFDDYISRPKPNGYQSLHTVVTAEDGRPLEVQIRTNEMHSFAEYGVAAHWRYKEEGGSNFAGQKYDEKIAWLRQLLAWKTEVADAVVGQEEIQREWVEKLKSATLDDRIFVMTPQARVLELPVGATPVDFAYHLHTDVGHRCRGAKVDGIMVPLNTQLKNGQTCESSRPRARRARQVHRATGWVPATPSARARVPKFVPGSTPSTCRKPWPTAARWWKNPCSAKARRPSTWRRWRKSWALRKSTSCSCRWARMNSVCATWSRRCTTMAKWWCRKTPCWSAKAALPAWSRAPSPACWWWEPRA